MVSDRPRSWSRSKSRSSFFLLLLLLLPEVSSVPFRGWIQRNSLGPPALSPFPRPTNLECNNMAIVVYCYENLLIVSRSSGQELWMGCGSLHSAVLLGAPWVFFFRKTLSRRPIVANSIHSWSATRAGSWPDCRGAILQLLLCRLPPQIRCSITLRKFLGNSWTIPRASIELH